MVIEFDALDGKLAAELSRKMQIDDNELEFIIRIEKLVLAFLEGKGAEWTLAAKPLMAELRMFEGFLTERTA